MKSGRMRKRNQEMKYQQYKLKFYVNLRHAIYVNGTPGEMHPHTWEIVLHIARIRDQFVPFSETEKEIEGFLDRFQEKTLNEFEPFDRINPTVENAAVYFRDEIKTILNRSGWLFLMMEISETPSRTFVLSMIDEIDIGAGQTISALADSILDDIEGKR